MAVKARVELTLASVSDGKPGTNGVGIKSTAISYQAGASQTSAPTGAWVADPPKLTTALPYLWTKTYITYTDGKTSTSYSVSSTLDGLEVGGRNYFRYTADMNTVDVKHHNAIAFSGIYSYNGNYAGFSDTGDGLKYAFVGQTVNDGICFPLSYDDCIKTGDDLIISFEYRGTISDAGNWYFLQRAAPNPVFRPGNILTPNATEWQRIEYKIPSHVDINPRRVSALLLFTDNSITYSSTDWIEIRKSSLKLEKGNKATDWTPAPEDTQQDILDAQNSANDANNKIDTQIPVIQKATSEIELLDKSIKSMVTDANGQSLMTQTADGWTFNIGSIQSTLNNAVNDVTTIKGNIADVNAIANKANQLATDIEKKTAYITMSQDESGAPCIELGKADNEFKVRITNTSIDFMQGPQKIAYITNKSLYIQSSVVTDELKIGDGNGYIWKRRGNGNLGLRYVVN